MKIDPVPGVPPNRAAAKQALQHARSRVFAKQRMWVLLILVVGGAIALADGLTRPEMLTSAPEDTFTYSAVWGAWTFAAVMLPICLLYVKDVGSSLREGILLWFILGMVTFGKDFSYIRWPGAPIFVTDVALLGFLARLFVWPRRFRIRFDSLPAKLLLLFLAVGIFTLARSLLAGHELLLTMRDFAIAFYCLFAFVGFAVIRSWAAVQRAFLFFLLGAILSCINAVAWFFHRPEARRFLSPGDCVLAAFLCMLIATDRKMIRPIVGYSLAAVLAGGVILSNARTVYVELAFMLVLMALVGSRIRRRVRRFRIKVALGALAVLVFAVTIFARTTVGSAFINRSMRQLVSGTIDFQDDPDAVFRIAAWGETLSLVAQHPILGIGYGVILDPFTFLLSANGASSEEQYTTHVDTRPHNTYLTVLYQMGLVGFAALCALLVFFFRSGWKSLLAHKNNNLSTWLYLLLITQLTMVLYGGFNLFLETPFSASIFWLCIGIGWRIQNLLKGQRVPALVR